MWIQTVSPTSISTIVILTEEDFIVHREQWAAKVLSEQIGRQIFRSAPFDLNYSLLF
jgi:hypothetical protein